MSHDRWLRRDPRWIVGPIVLGFIQVAGTFGAARGQPEAKQPDQWAIALALVGPIALLLIPRHTRVLVGVVTMATFGYVALGYPYGPIFASFAVAVVVAVVRGARVAAWAVVTAALALAVVARVLVWHEPWSWGWLAGATTWALFVVGLGEFVRLNRARIAEARRAREESRRREAGEERLRIARELHDVVAHHMSLIHVQAGVALHLVDRKPEQVEFALATIKDASKEALDELRALIGVLRAEGEKAPRAPVASLASLDDLADRSSRAGVTTTVEIRGDLGSVPTAVDGAAFRIAQEAMTNVVRHSKATRAQIHVDVGLDVVKLTVQDNGAGLAGAPEGTGLRGMRERASAHGGSIVLGTGPDGGARLDANLPFGSDA